MDKFSKHIAIIIVIFTLIVSGMVVIDILSDIKAVKYNDRVDELLSDDVEIERKWLVDIRKIDMDLNQLPSTMIEQTYINFSPEIRVRKLNNGERYTCTVKNNMRSNGLIRDEYESEISEQEYYTLLKKKEGNTICKTRYEFNYNGYVATIDIFHGELSGLAYLEVEFLSNKEAANFNPPNWVVKDVTSYNEYKNGYLARYGIPPSFYEFIADTDNLIID